MEKEFAISVLVPSLKGLAGDDQDGIRVICVESMIYIAASFSKEDNQRNILPIFLTLFEDKSWKVRLSIA